MEPIFFDFESNFNTKNVCLVDLPKNQSIDIFANHLESNYSNKIEQTDIAIWRANTDSPFKISAITNQVYDRLLRKFPRANVYILHAKKFRHKFTYDLASDGKHYLSKPYSDELLNQARESELKHYAEEYGAVLSARKGFVYKAPSGIYTDKFLRVGNIQKNRQIIDAIFFWMLPYMKSCAAIVTDTWSIGSIALNAAHLLERHQENQRCIVEMFPEYIENVTKHQPIIDNLKNQIQKDGSCMILVLFSVVQSGDSLTKSREIFKNSIPQENLEFLAIYSLSDNAQIDSLCSGIQDVKFVDKEKNVVIKIDSSSYFPTIVSDKPLNIRQLNAAQNKEFFDSYKGLDAVRIHRNVYDSNGRVLRHHAFDIEVESFLDDFKFRKKFENELSNLPEISLVVVPNHPAGKRLGEDACNFLAKAQVSAPNLIIHDNLHPEELCREKGQIIRNSDRGSKMLILDDVSITGERLNYYQKSLREYDYSGQIFYLVCVARPDNPLAWEDRIKNLRYRDGDTPPHSVKCIEHIVLPNWRENNCPWCLEYEWLRKLLNRQTLTSNCKDLAIDRHEVLNRAADDKGLVNQVLWIPPGISRPALTPGSIFLSHENTSEADVIASVSGAIQRMRVDTDEKFQLKNEFQQPRVLLPDDYCGPAPKFNDHILQLAILRSMLPAELTRWNDEEESTRNENLLDNMVKKNKSLKLEYAIAISQHKASIEKDVLGNLRDLELIEFLI